VVRYIVFLVVLLQLEGNIKKTLLGLGLRNRQTVLLRRRDHPTEAAAAQESRQQAILGAVTPALGPQPIATPAVAMSIDTSHNPAPLLLHGPPLGSPKLGSLSPGQRFATSPGLISSSPLSRSFGRAPVWAEDTASEVSFSWRCVGESSIGPRPSQRANDGSYIKLSSSTQGLN